MNSIGGQIIYKKWSKARIITTFDRLFPKPKNLGEISWKSFQNKKTTSIWSQGATLGNWEFLSQTNNNADCVP